MNETKKTYTGHDVAFIIPTKDRPEKVKNVLESIASQTMSCGRLIVVDGGQSVKDICMGFVDRLPVEYHECSPPGQIRQRNFGIAKLKGAYPLVGSLDDDIVLEPRAVEEIVAFWNRCEKNTAGVSFNIVNIPSHRYSWSKAAIGMSSSQQGRILRSGYNVLGSPTDTDLRVQWLPGGATVWRRGILEKFTNREISSRWAICEDVIFSYPIGKEFPLYVCANARARHEHIYDHKARMKYRYYGRTITLWRLYFVESHAELSRLFFLWMLLGQIIARCVSGIFLFRSRDIQYAIGQIEGALAGLRLLTRGSDLLPLLSEDTMGDRN